MKAASCCEIEQTQGAGEGLQNKFLTLENYEVKQNELQIVKPNSR